jgi:dihydroxyacetone kinase
MSERLVAAVGARAGDRLLVVLNGSGATTLMELFIVYRAVHAFLKQRGNTRDLTGSGGHDELPVDIDLVHASLCENNIAA